MAQTENIAFRGKRTCICVVTSLPFVEKTMIAKGLIKESIDIHQMGYNQGGVSASAGTHDRGGCTDTSQWTDAHLKVWRECGWTMQHRTPEQGFSHHAHGWPKGCPHLSSGAKYQASEWQAGRNGLRGKGPITGPSPKGKATPTWKAAMAKAKPAPAPSPSGGDKPRKPAEISSYGWIKSSTAAQKKLVDILYYAASIGCDVKTVYGYVEGTNSHVDGRTWDIMIPDTPDGNKTHFQWGDKIREFILGYKGAKLWDMHYLVWHGRITSTTSGKPPGGEPYKGSSPHDDHIHVTFRSDAYVAPPTSNQPLRERGLFDMAATIYKNRSKGQPTAHGQDWKDVMVDEKGYPSVVGGPKKDVDVTASISISGVKVGQVFDVTWRIVDCKEGTPTTVLHVRPGIRLQGTGGLLARQMVYAGGIPASKKGGQARLRLAYKTSSPDAIIERVQVSGRTTDK